VKLAENWIVADFLSTRIDLTSMGGYQVRPAPGFCLPGVPAG